jgi:hypothetical protein
MSRDQLISALQSLGAFSLIQTLEDVEAGRVRRVRLAALPGDPAINREVIEFLRSLGAEVDLPLPSIRPRLRRAG